jgi:hypothetical protein
MAPPMSEVRNGKIKRRRPAVVRGVEYDVFGVKADVNQRPSECPLLAISRHFTGRALNNSNCGRYPNVVVSKWGFGESLQNELRRSASTFNGQRDTI